VTKRPVGSIVVRDRHRQDLGDIDGLAKNIAEVGLLHPVVVTPDIVLIAGARRLAACKQLGWDEIPVTVVKLAEIVRGEFAENTQRKDWTPSEMVAIKRAIEPLMKAQAAERIKVGRPPLGKFPEGETGRAADKVAAFVGKDRRTVENAEARCCRGSRTGKVCRDRAGDGLHRQGARSIQQTANGGRRSSDHTQTNSTVKKARQDTCASPR
jgi:hypothetical protein